MAQCGFQKTVDGKTFHHREQYLAYVEKWHPEDTSLVPTSRDVALGYFALDYDYANQRYYVHSELSGFWVYTRYAKNFGFTEAFDPVWGHSLFHRASQSWHTLGWEDIGKTSFFQVLPPVFPVVKAAPKAPPPMLKAPPPPPPKAAPHQLVNN